MKKTLKFAALAVVAGLFMAGCCDCNKKSPAAFEETVWQLVQLDGKAVKHDNNFTIAFLRTNRITGKGACNTFMGGWEYDRSRENGLKMTQVASTMMACLNGMDVEANYFKALGEVTGYELSGTKLLLFSGSDMRAVFEATAKRVE